MSVIVESQVRERLAKLGISESSRNWVIKALDPASSVRADGIPDASHCSVTRPEYTVQANISCPVSIGTPTWDLMLIFPPGDCTACIWVAGTSGIDFSANTPSGVIVAGTINFQTLELKPTSSGANECFVISTVAAPPTTPTITAFNNYAPAGDVLTFRSQFRSATCILQASEMANGGDVFAAQYPFDARMKHLALIENTDIGSGTPFISQCTTMVIPLNEADLTLSARNPYVGRAKDGVYMPFRMMGPTQPFADVSYNGGCGTYRTTDDLVQGVVLPSAFQTTSPDSLLEGMQLPHTVRFVQNDSSGYTSTSSPFFNAYLNSAAYSSNTGWDNTGCGVVFFRGLANNGINSASVLVKVIAGLEVCPRPTSTVRAYVKPAALYEPRAVEAYYAIASELQSAYPAKYNSLGAILPLIAGAASRILPSFMLGAKAAMRDLLGDVPPSRSRPEVVLRERVAVREPSLARRSSSVRSAKPKVTIKSKKKR